MSKPSTTKRSVPGRREWRAGLWLAALAGVLGIAPGRAFATHERAALITWVPTTGNTVEFTVTGAWRRSAYSTANGRCRDPNDTTAPVLGSIPCSGADGFADPGDVIVEEQGGTQFNPGEGAVVGSPLGPLLYVVTSVDPANDWLFAEAIDPTSLPAVDETITKTYTSSAARVAFIQDCCRISNTAGGNQHINNPDGNYRIETLVTPGGGNRSPISTMPPIVPCPKDGMCAFAVPASDPDGDVVTFRLSTPTEASGSGGGFDQPGPPDAPNAASIDANTGVYTWNTTGATVGSAGSNTYYSTQVMLEDRDAMNNVKSRIAVDFLIQIVDQGAGVPPVFDHGPTPQCGSTITVTPGATASFTVQASDSDFGQTVTLNAVGAPAGATFTPPLPATGNPVSSVFNWVTDSADAGSTQVIQFTATDTASLQAQCSLTIQVAQCQTDADCDDDNACTTDVCDPMDPNANATTGCVNSPITCDPCQVCDVDNGCTGAVCTPNSSTTATATATATPTATATSTATGMATATATNTGPPPPTSTPSASPTPSQTPTPTIRLCAEAPTLGCIRPMGFKRPFTMNSRDPPFITWRWRTIGQVDVATFGQPDLTTHYALCVYHGTPATLLFEMTIPAGAVCRDKPCWKSKEGKGFRFKDKDKAYSGIGFAILRSRTTDPLADLVVRAKGVNTPMPPMPMNQLVEPVLTQLVKGDGPECWETSYSFPALRFNEQVFKDKND